ncbi:MAG: putative metal-binding motif-containing protein [Deltaproteobacteria bacterium]|nr:putative metal-binding motif-containing protein [Deltaproteobacteria bacterium]
MRTLMRTQNSKRAQMAALLTAVMGMSACGDDGSCPEGMVLAMGVCVPDEDMGGDLGPSCTPTGEERCNGSDDDCDGDVDEGLSTALLFEDGDADGFGGVEVEACGPGSGIVEVGGDCDDSDGDINPGATETCNGEDDDCDGATDEGVLTTLGTPQRLMLDNLSSSDIALVATGEDLIVAYRDDGGALQWVVVNPDGTLVSGPHLARTATGAPNDPVMAVGLDGRVLLAWSEETGGTRDAMMRYLNLDTPSSPGPVVPAVEDRLPNDLVFFGDRVFLFVAGDTRLDVRSFLASDLSSPSSQVFIKSGYSIRAVATPAGFLQAAYEDYTDSVAAIDLDRVVADPLGLENVPSELTADPGFYDIALVERGDDTRVLAVTSDEGTKRMFMFDAGSLGSPPTPAEIGSPGDSPAEAQSVDVESFDGSFDVVLCGEPGYQCSYRNVALDGTQSEPVVFSMANYIPDGEVARVAPNRGAVVYSGGIPSGTTEHDLYVQPIGCR